MRPRRAMRSHPAPATVGARDLATQLFGRNPDHVLALLRAAWPAAVGPELARRTEVIGLQGRTLRVRVPDAAWHKVIHRMRRDIMGRLYQTVGALAPTALGLQEGQVAAEPVTATTPPLPTAPPEVTAAIRDAAAVIPDLELRALFAASAARYLKRSADA